MANDPGVAKRYAAALFDVAQRDGAIDAILNDLKLVATDFEQVPYLKDMIMQPLVATERKLRVLSDAFGDRTTATTLNFLYLLVNKRRIKQLDEIAREYRALVDERQGRLVARVQTAVSLSKGQLDALQNALVARTGKKIEMQTEIDSSMIGGVRVRLGDTIIDGSVSGRLERIKRQLLAVD